MKFRNILVFLGLVAFILHILEKFFVREEETRIGIRVGLDPNSKVSEVDEEDGEDGEDTVDIFLDELEQMDENEQAETIHKLAEHLHEGEEEFVEDKKVNTKAKKKNNKNIKLNNRQERIMDTFKESEKIDTDLLRKKIKKVTVRTLRRDLDKLEKIGLVKKIGKTKGAYYVQA